MEAGKTGVLLPANWPGNFRRTMKSGKESRLLEFAPGVLAYVDDAELEAIRGDMGTALFFAAVQNGKCVPKADHKLTAAFVEETTAHKAKAKSKKAAS